MIFQFVGVSGRVLLSSRKTARGRCITGKYYYLEWIWTGFWTGIEYIFSIALQLDAQHDGTTFGIVHVYRALVASNVASVG